MKLRKHILKRFDEVSKLYKCIAIESTAAGNYAYTFQGKFVLVVNELEHASIQKHIKRG